MFCWSGIFVIPMIQLRFKSVRILSIANHELFHTKLIFKEIQSRKNTSIEFGMKSVSELLYRVYRDCRSWMRLYPWRGSCLRRLKGTRQDSSISWNYHWWYSCTRALFLWYPFGYSDSNYRPSARNDRIPWTSLSSSCMRFHYGYMRSSASSLFHNVIIMVINQSIQLC